MANPFNLRQAVLFTSECDSAQDHQKACDQAQARLDRLAALAVQEPVPDLPRRLRAKQDTVLGHPCKPFQPPIHLEAARAIEDLERDEGVPGPELLHLVSRLTGFYGVGPESGIMAGRPEFGYRLTDSSPIKLEAAACILALAPDLGERLGVLPEPPICRTP